MITIRLSCNFPLSLRNLSHKINVRYGYDRWFKDESDNANYQQNRIENFLNNRDKYSNTLKYNISNMYSKTKNKN